jgi:hypothetical protein
MKPRTFNRTTYGVNVKNTLETLKITRSHQGSMNTAAQAKMTETQAPAQSATAGTQTSSTAGIHMHETITSLTGSETNHNGPMFDEEFLADGYTAEEHDRREGLHEDPAEPAEDKGQAGAAEETKEDRYAAGQRLQENLRKAWIRFITAQEEPGTPVEETQAAADGVEKARAELIAWAQGDAELVAIIEAWDYCCSLYRGGDNGQSDEYKAAYYRFEEMQQERGRRDEREKVQREREKAAEAAKAVGTMPDSVQAAFFGSLLKQPRLAEKLMRITYTLKCYLFLAGESKRDGMKDKKPAALCLLTHEIFDERADRGAHVLLYILRRHWDKYGCIPTEAMVRDGVDQMKPKPGVVYRDAQESRDKATEAHSLLDAAMEYPARPGDEKWTLEKLQEYLMDTVYRPHATLAAEDGASEMAAAHEDLSRILRAIQEVTAPAAKKERMKDIYELAEAAIPDGHRLMGTGTSGLLGRGGAGMIVGNAGKGKSTMGMQFMASSVCGKPAFGIPVDHPLRIFVPQAENDDGDMQDMASSSIRAVEDQDWFKEDPEKYKAMLKNNLRFERCVDKTGDAFLTFLEEKMDEYEEETGHPFDLVAPDPLTAFTGFDIAKPELTDAWTRGKINPMLDRRNCGLIFFHHTPKPVNPKNGGPTDLMYSGGGCANWVNWARFIMTIMPTGTAGTYEFTVHKRGKRTGWVDADGNPSDSSLWMHSTTPGELYWYPVKPEKVKVMDQEAIKKAVWELGKGHSFTESARRATRKSKDTEWVKKVQAQLNKWGFSRDEKGESVRLQDITDIVTPLVQRGEWSWSPPRDGYEYLTTGPQLKPGTLPPDIPASAESPRPDAAEEPQEQPAEGAEEGLTDEVVNRVFLALVQHGGEAGKVRRNKDVFEEVATLASQGCNRIGRRTVEEAIKALVADKRVEQEKGPRKGRHPTVFLRPVTGGQK